jgi:hypothetical protein
MISRYINSFTSYEFPSPFPPYQEPLSRLEFPIDQWFLGVSTGFENTSWAVRCQAWTNISRESGLKMQDSDWDNEDHPFQKTIFSDSRCRLNRGLLIDVSLIVGSGLERSFNLRPVVGYRYQYFYFTTHDGFQGDINANFSGLPGDGIDFRQIFYHYYVGSILESSFNANDIVPRLPRVRILAQIDYAGVNAVNEDLHLLRLGDRVTRDNTRGHCWHVALSAGIALNNRLRARIEGDFKRIITHGSHRLTNSLFGLDFSFDGSRVWSDQASVGATAEMEF